MNHDDPTHVVGTFKTDLQHMRRKAGNPSYRDLVRRTRGVLTIPTVGRAFSGGGMPTWTTVEHILIGCEATESMILSWRQRWAAAMDVIRPLPHHQQAGAEPVTHAETHAPTSLPRGRECPSCGAWVTNAARHAEWHDSITSADPEQPLGRQRRVALRRVG